MNREIKFRGYHKEKGMLDVYGFNEKFVFKNDLNSPEPMENIFPIEECILMQFTGFKDKNGNKIYEGDIVTYKRSIGNWTGQFITTTHEIVFSEEVFAFVMKYGNSYIKLRKHWGYEYEVVGNIYENPELLKE